MVAATLAVVLAATACGGGDKAARPSTDDHTAGGVPTESTPSAAPLKVGQTANLGPLQVILDSLKTEPGRASDVGRHPESWRLVIARFVAVNPTDAPVDPGDTGLAVSAGSDGVQGDYYSYMGFEGVPGTNVLGHTPIRAGGQRRIRWILAVPVTTDIRVVLSGDDGAQVTWLGDATG